MTDEGGLRMYEFWKRNQPYWGALPEDDPTRRRPDISLAKQHLDWSPTIDLREGLAQTIDWFRSINVDEYRPPTPNFSSGQRR